MVKTTVRFAHFASRTPIMELEMDPDDTMERLCEAAEAYLMDEENCLMRMWDRWYLEKEEGEKGSESYQKRFVEITNTQLKLSISAMGIEDYTTVYLKGPLTTETAGVGQILALASRKWQHHLRKQVEEIEQIRNDQVILASELKLLLADVRQIKEEQLLYSKLPADIMKCNEQQAATLVTIQTMIGKLTSSQAKAHSDQESGSSFAGTSHNQQSTGFGQGSFGSGTAPKSGGGFGNNQGGGFGRGGFGGNNQGGGFQNAPPPNAAGGAEKPKSGGFGGNNQGGGFQNAPPPNAAGGAEKPKSGGFGNNQGGGFGGNNQGGGFGGNNQGGGFNFADEVIASNCLSEFPLMPLKALWNALCNKNSTSIIMKIILDVRCGFERRSTGEEGDFQMPSAFALKLANNGGLTPLMLVVFANRAEVVLDLLRSEKVDVNAKDILGFTALHIATRYTTSVSMIESLIRFGANVNATTANKGQTPLHTACQGPITLNNFVPILVAKGADVNAADHDGITPLMMAINICHFAVSLESINALLDKGADAKVRYRNQDTLLHIPDASTELLTLLLEKGLDINAANKDGNTPLHLAARRGNLEKIKFFVSKGANINLLNWHGESPLAIFNSNVPFHASMTDEDRDRVRELLSNTADNKS